MQRPNATNGCNARCLADAAALLGFKSRKAFGCSRRMQIHTTSSWQASFCLVSCLLFVLAAFCCRKSLHLPFSPCPSNRWLWIGVPQLSQVRFKDSQSAGVSSWTTAEWNPVKVQTSKDTSQQWSKNRKNISDICKRKDVCNDNRRVTQVTSVVDNAMKTKKRKFAAHVFRALSTTEEEDITCGHTLTWKMNDHLDDITLEHCSTVTSSRSIIFSKKRTATLAQTLQH